MSILHLKINWRSPSQTFCETFFCITFSLFLKVSEVCNISNKCWFPNISPNKIFSRKTPYTPPLLQKGFALSVAEYFRNFQFLPFLYFTQWMRCAIFQINANLLITERNINIFTQETLYSSFISKKNWRSPSGTFFEISTSTSFSLFLTVSEVCNIANKYWLPNKWTTNIFLHKTPYTALSFQKKMCSRS